MTGGSLQHAAVRPASGGSAASRNAFVSVSAADSALEEVRLGGIRLIVVGAVEVSALAPRWPQAVDCCEAHKTSPICDN